MPQTETIIGDQSFVKLLAATLNARYTRYEKLKALGGFSVYDLMKETGGLSYAHCDRVLRKMKLHSEPVLIPGKQALTRIYLPEGVKPPK